jgi:arylsulfatase A-like enzyme
MPLPAPGEARIPLRLGRESVLRMCVAVLADPDEPPGKPVRFEVFVHKNGKRTRIEQMVLNPVERVTEQKWLPRTYPLTDLGSGLAELEISTQADLAAGEQNDVGGPRILVSEPVLVTSADEPQEIRNVILVSLDTLRADHMSCYGYKSVTSPFLDRFAEENVFVETGIAPSNWTLPSHVSMFSSLYPSTHGIGSMSQSVRKVEMLACILKKEGFSTKAITDGGLMAATFGFCTGFDSYEDHNHAGFGTIMPAAKNWLRNQAGEPFFLFLHTYDTHSPYNPPKRFLDRFEQPDGVSPELLKAPPDRRLPHPLDSAQSAKDLKYVTNMYDGCIMHVDEEMEGLFTLLEELGYWENTMVIVTSDHGEEFMEHGRMGHGNQLYEESIRVPLLMRVPGVRGKKITSVAQILDIPPTIVDYLGIDSNSSFQGESLMGLWNETVPKARTAYSEMEDLVARRTIGEKFICNLKNGHEQIYDLINDPTEAHNLVAEETERCQRLTEDVVSYRKENESLRDSDAAGSADVSGELADELRALGYL